MAGNGSTPTGAEDSPRSQTVGGGVEYPLLDGLGSVRQLTDAGGTVICALVTMRLATCDIQPGAGVTRLGLPGGYGTRQWAGLSQARHYHPGLGAVPPAR